GKQHTREVFDDALDGFRRGEIAPTGFQRPALGHAPLLADVGQFGNNGLNVEYSHVRDTCESSGKWVNHSNRGWCAASCVWPAAIVSGAGTSKQLKKRVSTPASPSTRQSFAFSASCSGRLA